MAVDRSPDRRSAQGTLGSDDDAGAPGDRAGQGRARREGQDRRAWAGLFGGAGLFGLGAFAALTACIIAALDEAMPLWLAALIPAVVYAAVAGVLALRGRAKVRGPARRSRSKQPKA